MLTSAGAGSPATWTTPASAISVTDDTTTNATRYPLFASVTTGNLSATFASSTKLQFNPSTGALTTTSLTPTNALGIAYGGTGATTATAGFNALAPSQTSNSGKYLTTDGTNSSWATVGGGASISNDTTTATYLYPLFAAATSGTPSTIYTGNTKLLYKPSTGDLQSTLITTNTVTSAAATSLTLQSAGTTGVTIDTSQNLQFNSGYGSVATAYGCRAWVNFNGTGTVAIRGSGNVSSITDNGVGDYTVNFTTAMPDVNYAGVSLPNDGTSGTNLVIACENQTRTKSTSQFHVWTAYGGNLTNKTLYDVDTVNVSVFR
jgi:hypothetical protein